MNPDLHSVPPHAPAHTASIVRVLARAAACDRHACEVGCKPMCPRPTSGRCMCATCVTYDMCDMCDSGAFLCPGTSGALWACLVFVRHTFLPF